MLVCEWFDFGRFVRLRVGVGGNGDVAPSGWVWLLVGGRKDGKPEIALPLADGVGRIYPVGKIVVTE